MMHHAAIYAKTLAQSGSGSAVYRLQSPFAARELCPGRPNLDGRDYNFGRKNTNSYGAWVHWRAVGKATRAHRKELFQLFFKTASYSLERAVPT
jgi:hypothetical protein